MTDGITQFRISYELNPIVLNNGIATAYGGQVSILSLLQPEDFPAGVLFPPDTTDTDFLAHFQVMAGGELIANEVARYPFANQNVAANAIIVQPLRFSLKMTAPASAANGGYANKLAAFTSLQNQLKQHNITGGTYTVGTPSFIYPTCLLIALRDISSTSAGGQVQTEWQWDFEAPLLTLADAAAAQNALMASASAGLPTTGDPPTASGPQANVGVPTSGVGPTLVPSSQPAGASSPSPTSGNGS